MNYEELANLVESMPRIPVRKMKCHPLVAMALRNWTRTGEYAMYDELAMLTGAPVYEDPSMELGAWEFYEDEKVAASGNIWDSSGASM